MNNSKLDIKRKLSFSDDDISFKKKTTKETNLLSSSTKEYRENQIQVDVTSLDNINGDRASTSYSYSETSKALKAINEKRIKRIKLVIGNTNSLKKKNECLVFTKEFTCKSKLIIHERSHTGEKPYECIVCEKRFSLNSNRIRHEKTHINHKN